MTTRIALMAGGAESCAGSLATGRLDASTWMLGPPPSGEDVALDVGDRPPLFIVCDGRIVAEARLRAAVHPLGLSGSVASLLLRRFQAQGGPRDWLDAALAEIARQARHAYGLSALLAEPAPGDTAVTSALVGAGYLPIEGSSILRRELVAEFWRRRDVFIIAEAGSNWRMGTPARDLAMAKTLIYVAAAAGADAVKFQTFRPETLYAVGAGSSDYLADAGITATMHEMFADLAMPRDMLPLLVEHARQAGIGFMSTAFSPDDFAAVDALIEVHKIASYEISHIRLIELAARSGKPTVLSTGAATLEDVAWAVDHYHRCGGRDLCLMQCTAKYPAPFEALNLAAITELARIFGVSVGLSDHSRDPVVGPLAATALGARAIEKHFTLDNRLPGPDHAFAVTPAELHQLVAAVRVASDALGSGTKAVHPAETELASFAQRGLQAIRPIEAGDVLIEDANIAILRPGKQAKGIHPRHLPHIAGRRATRSLRPGQGLQMGDWTDGDVAPAGTKPA